MLSGARGLNVAHWLRSGRSNVRKFFASNVPSWPRPRPGMDRRASLAIGRPRRTAVDPFASSGRFSRMTSVRAQTVIACAICLHETVTFRWCERRHGNELRRTSGSTGSACADYAMGRPSTTGLFFSASRRRREVVS
jgi:hypothetical protein